MVYVGKKGVETKMLWFLGENLRPGAFFRTVEGLQAYGIDLDKMLVHFPNAPLRRSPWLISKKQFKMQ